MPTKAPGQRSGSGARSALEHVARDAEDAQSVGERRRRQRSAYTILVVDDHPPMLYATARMLRDAGFETIEADTGGRAVELAPGASAIVLDVNLPDIHGVQVLQSIRRTVSAAVPIILTSAVFVDELHRGVGLEAGADAYLIAPLSHETLIATLEQLL